MATSTMIHVRIDEELKDKATQALDAMGLTLADAVRIYLKRIAADQAIPFDVKVPNSETVAAMEAARRGEGEVVTLDELAKEWDEA